MLLVWEEVTSPVDFTPTWELEVSLLIRGLPEGYNFVVDVDFWMVRKEHVGEGPILRHMSEPLRFANFVAIRRKANICRRALVKEFVVKQRKGNSNLWVGVHNWIFIIHAFVLAYLQHQRCANDGEDSSSYGM